MDKKHFNLASKGFHVEELKSVASQKWLIYIHPVTGMKCRLPGDKASIRHYYAKGFKVYVPEPPPVEPMEIEPTETMVEEMVEEKNPPKPKKKPKKKTRGGKI